VNRKDKPYLLSVGISIPLFGIYGHWYMDTKKKRKLQNRKALGIGVVWTTYTKVMDTEAESLDAPVPQKKNMKS
jgi:hypothetical protein